MLLLTEFICLCLWNTTEVNRFALSQDFAAYQQAVYLFLHGSLGIHGTAGFMYGNHGNPYSFWKTEAELDIVPLSFVYWIWPHAVVLKWFQDAALVGAQAIAFAWICDLVATHERELPSRRSGMLLIALGLVLLVGNPWFAWASSFDFHSEPVATFFVLGAARNLYYNRRRAWLWAVPGLMCSALGATYVAAVAVSAILSGRARLRSAMGILVVAVIWFASVSALGLVTVGNPGAYSSILNGGATDLNNVISSGRVTYATIIKGALEHPINVLKALWGNHANIWAPASAAGILGIFWIPVLIPAVFVLLEGGFARGFSLPSFQNIVVGGLVAVGTVALMTVTLSRLQSMPRPARSLPGFRVLAVGLVCLLAVNTIVWAALWYPRVSTNWLRVPSQTASVLAGIKARIQPDDEVVVSQGIAGQFAARRYVYALALTPTDVQLRARHVWFILSPEEGIEVWDASETLGAITQLESTPGVRLVEASAGVWAFEWSPPKSVHTLVMGRSTSDVMPGWVLDGPVANTTRSGPAANWSATNSGEAGYVVDEAYDRELPGLYSASVRLAVSTRAKVEIWDATASKLLRATTVSNTHGIRDVRLRVRLRTNIGQRSYGSFGLWSIEPIVLAGDELEARVWAPKSLPGSIKVYTVELTRFGS